MKFHKCQALIKFLKIQLDQVFLVHPTFYVDGKILLLIFYIKMIIQTFPWLYYLNKPIVLTFQIIRNISFFYCNVASKWNKSVNFIRKNVKYFE